MTWQNILKEDYDKRKVGYHFNLSQDMKEEIRGEQPNQLSEMNKHRLFMRGKDLKKKIENLPRPSSILDIHYGDIYSDDETNTYNWEVTIDMYGSPDFGNAYTISQQAQKFIDKIHKLTSWESFNIGEY